MPSTGPLSSIGALPFIGVLEIKKKNHWKQFPKLDFHPLGCALGTAAQGEQGDLHVLHA